MPIPESDTDGDLALSECFKQLRGNVKGHWSTQAEATLLAALEQLHARLMARSARTYQKVEDLYLRTSAAQIMLTNTFNSLKLLSQEQFVQHRVAIEDLQLRREREQLMANGLDSDEGGWEEEDEQSTGSAVSPTQPSGYQQRAKKQAIVRRMYAYVEASREALLEEGVRIPLCPEDVEELAGENPYCHRRLCALVGTDAFLRGAEIGCADRGAVDAEKKNALAALSQSASPAGAAVPSVPSSAAAPRPSLPTDTNSAVPAVLSTIPRNGAETSAAALTPGQEASRQSTSLVLPPVKSAVPPPAKSVVPPPKPAAPFPPMAAAAQRVEAKAKQRQALFQSSSSSDASSSSSYATHKTSALNKKVKPKMAPAERTGKSLFQSSSSSSESDAETTSSSDSPTLSSTANSNQDAPHPAAAPRPPGKAVNAPIPFPSLPPPPPPSVRPPAASPESSSRSSSSATSAASSRPTASPPLSPPSATLTNKAQTEEITGSENEKSTPPAAPPPPLADPTTLPPPPLVFAFDDNEGPSAVSSRAPLAAASPTPSPPPPQVSRTVALLPTRGGKLLSTSSDED